MNSVIANALIRWMKMAPAACSGVSVEGRRHRPIRLRPPNFLLSPLIATLITGLGGGAWLIGADESEDVGGVERAEVPVGPQSSIMLVDGVLEGRPVLVWFDPGNAASMVHLEGVRGEWRRRGLDDAIEAGQQLVVEVGGFRLDGFQVVHHQDGGPLPTEDTGLVRVGSREMRKLVVDYSRRRGSMILSRQRPRFDADEAVEVTVNWDYFDLPRIPVTIGGREMLLIAGLASAPGFTLEQRDYRALAAEGYLTDTGLVHLQGPGERANPRPRAGGIAERVEIGGIEIDRVCLVADPDVRIGNVGMNALARYNPVFDLGRSRIWLRPPQHDDPEIPAYLLGQWGLNVYFDTEGGRSIVRSVVRDSPAARAGFEAGDLILRMGTVDGNDMNLRIMLRKLQAATDAGEAIEATIMRGSTGVTTVRMRQTAEERESRRSQRGVPQLGPGGTTSS